MTTATFERSRHQRKARSEPLDDPDVQRMLRARDGDDGAFEELVDLYWNRIQSHFIRSLGNREDCEDLTQEVFMRLYRSRGSYQPRAKFVTWLFHITQNVARNAVRSRRRRPCVYLDTVSENSDCSLIESLLAGRCEEPSRPLERDEIRAIVRDAVSQLGSRQRTAMELHQFKGRTYNEVAEKMEMSPEAAKSLLYRARNQLRENLAFFMETN